MNKKLRIVMMILLVFACSIVLFACKPNQGNHDPSGDGNQEPENPRPEFIVTDYKTTFEFDVGDDTFLFYSWNTEDMVYSYQSGEDDEKLDETYEINLDGEWYLYEKNSFDYWTKSVTDDPYADEFDIKQEDFEPGSDGYYAIKADKLAYYSDNVIALEGVDFVDMRVKFNEDELPVEMLVSIYLSMYDLSTQGKITFEYNTGETFVLPEQFVPSYNVKITYTSTYSANTHYCLTFDNVSYMFSVDNNNVFMNDSVHLEIESYDTFITANWYNNQWQYYSNKMPQSIGFNMFNIMPLIDFGDFTQEGEYLVLPASKLREYSPIILYNANPSAVFLTELRIKVADGQIVEMIYTDYFSDYDITLDPITSTVTFEYGILTIEDMQ